MTSSPARGRTLAATLIALGIAMSALPVASADPDTGTPADGSDPAAAAAAAPLPVVLPVESDDAGLSPTSDACRQFATALGYAATNYEDFAYNTAGGGNSVNYADPSVQSSNIAGRTALREAASVAWNASNGPGVTPDVSAPMHSWSLHATKLLFIMGLRGGGDSLNNAATELNDDAHDAQMACALSGTPAI